LVFNENQAQWIPKNGMSTIFSESISSAEKTVLQRKLFAKLIFLSAGFIVSQHAGEAITSAAAQSAAGGQASNASPVPSPSSPAIIRKAALPPRYMEVGKSVRGSSIMAAIYGSGKKRVILFGGIHGNEVNSSVLAKALMGSLGQEAAPEGLTVIIVPDVNPDGLFANQRINARGVDINRNFPSTSWSRDYPDEYRFPGTEPASEPETRAIISLLEKYPPDFIITLHAALGCVNWDGPGEQLARVIAGVNGYPLCPYLGYETPGSLGTLMGTDKKVPVVTIELRGARASEVVQENLPALRAVLSYMASSK
jgi:murein peptide amidase A